MLILRTAVATALCAFAVAAGQTIDEVVDKTVEKYSKVNSFYARITQTLCDEENGICRIFTGSIYFLKPNFFRMEIENPSQIYVGDSSSLWIYLPDKKRAVRQRLSPLPFAVNPDLFLKDYEERFTAGLASDESGFEISLTPREETDIYMKIIVRIDRRFEITGVSIFDAAGIENRFHFDKMELNKKISKAVFKFNPPEGTEIIEQ